MTVISKVWLTSAVTGLVAGSVLDFGGFGLAPAWALVLPAGAIALGMFLISYALEGEAARHDAEQANPAPAVTAPSRSQTTNCL